MPPIHRLGPFRINRGSIRTSSIDTESRVPCLSVCLEVPVLSGRLSCLTRFDGVSLSLVLVLCAVPVVTFPLIVNDSGTIDDL